MLAAGSSIVVTVAGLDNTGGGDLTSRLTAQLGLTQPFAVTGINLSVASQFDSFMESIVVGAAASAAGSYSGTVTLTTSMDFGSSADVASLILNALTIVCGIAPIECTVTQAPDLSGSSSASGPGIFTSIEQTISSLGQAAANLAAGINKTASATGTAASWLPFILIGGAVLFIVVLASGRKTNLTHLI